MPECTLPRYRCHKAVHAAKILAFRPEGDGRAVAHLDDPSAQDGHVLIMLPAAYVTKHTPMVGGYFVEYEDGYESYSPGEAFEAGYRPIPRETFESPEPLLQWFIYSHLPPHLQAVSCHFADMALRIVNELPRNPERTVALRKLLEAKDCAVRAVLYKG